MHMYHNTHRRCSKHISRNMHHPLKWAIVFFLALFMGCIQDDSPPLSPVTQPDQGRDIVYAVVDGIELTCDVYFPASPGPRPAVITVHGGAWQGGDKKDHARIAEALAAHGYVVFCINYRLAPANLFPAAVEDVQCAVVWVREHAKAYGVDPGKIALLGTSAGGHLAVLGGLTASTRVMSSVLPAPWQPSCGEQSADYRVQAVISCFGPLDLAFHSQENPGTRRIVTTFLGEPCQQTPSLCAAANPMTYVSHVAPPMLLIHGTLDDVVGYENSERFYHALSDAGGQVTLFPVEAGHGFIINTSTAKAGSALEAIYTFLEDTFSA